MVAYADREALERTRATGRAHYRSRSRGELWQKGATSGHTQTVEDVRVDCDGDAVLYVVRQEGPACHTGAATCLGEAAGGGARVTGWFLLAHDVRSEEQTSELQSLPHPIRRLLLVKKQA